MSQRRAVATPIRLVPLVIQAQDLRFIVRLRAHDMFSADHRSVRSTKLSLFPRATALSTRFPQRLFCDNASASRSVSSVTGTSAAHGRPFLVITTVPLLGSSLT